MFTIGASWTGPESMTLHKVTSPGAVTVLGTLPVRASDLSVSNDYTRATISWSDQRTDAWMYRVVKP